MIRTSVDIVHPCNAGSCCGKTQTVNQIHVPHDRLLIRQILARMRHDGCGGRAAKAELLTGVEGVSSRPVRKIVLLDGA